MFNSSDTKMESIIYDIIFHFLNEDIKTSSFTKLLSSYVITIKPYETISLIKKLYTNP